MHKNNSPGRFQSQSLGRPPQPTYSDEPESDLEQRESPKPTLSTNRISKSKSQQEASFRLVPQLTNASSDRNDMLFSSERHQQQRDLDRILTEFIGQWRQLSRTQLETISHLKEQRQAVASQSTQIKLQFLLTLWQVTAFRRKLHDVRLNLGVMQVQLETKPSTDRNKMLVLELLEKKLAKKLFFASWRFERLLHRVEELTTRQPKSNSFGERKIIQAELLLTALQRIVAKNLSMALTCIKKNVFIGNLFSPGSDKDSEEQCQQQQRQHQNYHLSPSALELTLSPNNYPLSTEKSNSKRPYSFFKQHPIVPTIVPEQESQQASSRIAVDVEPAQAQQISSLHRLILNLENDIKRLEGHYREDRPAKQREVYFNKWKIAFLRKHLQTTAKQHYSHQLRVKAFAAWSHLQSKHPMKQAILVEEPEEEEIPAPPKSYSVERKRLEQFIKRRRFLELIKLIGEMKDTQKIYSVCRQIYEKNLRAKVLYGLLVEKRLRQYKHHAIQQAEQLEQEEEELGEADEHESPSQIQQSYTEEQYAEQPKSHRQSSGVSERRDISIDESSNSVLTAELFRRDNLLTRTFMHFKRYCRIKWAVRILLSVLKRSAFHAVRRASSHQDKLNDRVERYLRQKQLSQVFKCFTVLKRAVYGKPGRPSIEHIVKARNRSIEEKYFSVLKLIWKMRLVREKKADRLRQLHCGFRAFAALKGHMESKVYLSRKRRQLESAIYSRKSTTFLRNLLRNYLENRQLASKTASLKDWIFDRETERIQGMLESWKKAAIARRSFNKVEDRLRRLKHTETKRKIFMVWWQQVYGTPRLSAPSQYDRPPTTEPVSPSGQHRYWLERYYEKLLSRSDSTDHQY